MKKNAAFILFVFLMNTVFVSVLFGETYAVRDRKRSRRLQVVREYNIPVKKGYPSVAALPALMSFWGASNWQVVKSSRFAYRQKPDSIRITSDNRGMPRRYYELTWHAPETDEIRVEQVVDVELFAFNKLYTRAKLPYAEEVLQSFPSSLVSDAKQGINVGNPGLQPICDRILKRTEEAEEVVELVCDWINDNIQFEKGQRTSDEAFTGKKGSCTPMSKLACALLRRMGIPAEMVSGKFIGSDNGHSFIEVYFPDAGWVFYDLSNWNRGFKSLDCLMTVGWCYRAGVPGNTKWITGKYCKETDKKTFQKLARKSPRCLRREPRDHVVAGVQIQKSSPPKSVRTRHIPISQLIMNLEIPPGVRDCTPNGKPASQPHVGSR